MAIKNIIARGIGFSPGSIKWIPTHGFGVGAVVVVPTPHCVTLGTVGSLFSATRTTPETLYNVTQGTPENLYSATIVLDDCEP